MIKAYCILVVSSFLLIAIGSADWLEGGYVGSGASSEMSSYFTDPIFTSPAGSYLSPDPALREMQISLDRPITVGGSHLSSDPALREMQVSMDRPLTLGSVVSRPATGKKTATTSTQTTTPTTTAAGRWSLTLSEGKTIYLELYQSGPRIFGRGSMTQGETTYGALASGTISGAAVAMEVVPQTGTELYSMIFDLNKLHLPSAYAVYRAGAQPASGTAKAIRMP